MRKAMWTTCLTVILVLLMMVVSVPSYPAAASAIDVTIHVDEKKGEIRFTPKYVGVCSNKKGKNCDGSEFKWTLAGPLKPGETLKITNAPNHLRCFSPDFILFEKTNKTTANMTGVTYSSGAPQPACTADEYGTYWPYVVVYTLADETEIVSDPGGIIHP